MALTSSVSIFIESSLSKELTSNSALSLIYFFVSCSNLQNVKIIISLKIKEHIKLIYILINFNIIIFIKELIKKIIENIIILFFSYKNLKSELVSFSTPVLVFN